MQKLLAILIPRIAWLYLHFVGITSKIVWFNPDAREKIEGEKRGFIYAFWHGRQVFMIYAFRHSPPAAVLVSKSKDGDYIAGVIDLFGQQTVRGSSSRRGAMALMDLVKTLESGANAAVTPDGPRGPKRVIAPGILYLAQKTSKPILPITYSARRKIVFHGWDDYWVPLPFNVIAVQVGNRISIAPEDDLEIKSAELAAELNRITDEADRWAAA